MLKKVLILSPSPGFGELIRQLLEDTGGFAPLVVTDAGQAMQLAQKEALALTILDADLGLKDFPTYISELRSHAPQTRLIVVPAKDKPDNPQLAELDANAILPSPFYLPDLVAAIAQLFGPLVPGISENRKVYGKPTGSLRVAKPEPEPDFAPEWLKDVSQSASYLARLSLESASQAALITRGTQVWAYAGELPELAVDELAGAVAANSTEGSGPDLARFIHLAATKANYMLYATNLGGGYQLALVFDAQMPFSQMRAHVGKLAKALATAPKELASYDKDEEEVKPQLTEAPRPEESVHADGTRVTSEGEPQPAKIAAMPMGNESAANIANRSIASKPRADLRYSFLLIPRLPKHQLVGDLTVRLTEWVPELSLAFAWRLEDLVLRQEFLGWSVTVLQEISPQFVARTMGEQLSHRIFADFPRLAQDNPSGQFWAAEILVIGGNMPTSTQIVDFIRETRKLQGAVR